MTEKTKAKKTSKKAPTKKVAVKKDSSKSKISKPKIEKSLPKLTKSVVEGMLEKKAKNIKILDLRQIPNRVSDFFVICDAESTTHVNAIAGSVSEMVKKLTNEKPFHSEGWENSQWILLDYVNVVAHIFMKETRDFYNIEELWADAIVSDY